MAGPGMPCRISKPVIGLVGGIGSGKSELARVLESLGGRAVSGDELGHEALTRPDVRDKICDRWGHDLLDSAGHVDRRRLGRVVFADPAERAALEALVFPWIERRICESLREIEADPAVPFAVLDAAIMLETGWGGVCDRVVFVDAPAAERARRVRESRGWGEADLLAREAAQMPLEEKRRRSDAVLTNSGTPAELRRRAEELLAGWGLTARPAR